MTTTNAEGFVVKRPSTITEYVNNNLHPTLKTAVLHQAQMSATAKRLLIYIQDHPESTVDDLKLDVSGGVAAQLGEFVLMGYVERIKGFPATKTRDAVPSTYIITATGLDAINRSSVSPTRRAAAITHLMSDYEPYIPPYYDHNDFRKGSMDAYKLPSLTHAGRVWP